MKRQGQVIIAAIRKTRGAPLYSPVGFIQRAFWLTALLAILHALGFRDYTSILSGTIHPSPFGSGISVGFGAAYIFAWFGFVLIAPILLIAAGLMALMNRHLPSKADLRN